MYIYIYIYGKTNTIQLDTTCNKNEHKQDTKIILNCSSNWRRRLGRPL